MGIETRPKEIVPEPSACGVMVSGTITRVSPSFLNVPAAQYFVVRLRRAALLVVVAALAAGCAGGPAEPGPVTLVLKHAKILGRGVRARGLAARPLALGAARRAGAALSVHDRARDVERPRVGDAVADERRRPLLP